MDDLFKGLLQFKIRDYDQYFYHSDTPEFSVAWTAGLYKAYQLLVLSAMTFTTTIQYLLLALLALFTLFNIYSLTTGKKKRKLAAANYQQTLRSLEQKAYELMQQKKLKFDVKQGYINDLNEGILLTFDTKHRMVGIVLKDAEYLFSYEEFVSCKQTYETLENKKISNISVEIETKDSIISLLFGSKAWKPNSYLGKFLLSDSKELCTLLEKYCLVKETSSPLTGQ
ncbi:hypothetical protein [Sphaerochaeta globosa]|uniref:Uncharacterized protein n=1 Tax=Sphaerochaeta globosa (strain ATCC BAA-1886 / DSM 22777 / Buddy) TaxID=158189 RepID=F0RZN8_SPHGB|nr:hypothetical protein [Sphaerochaeta globosa]ADY14789.1 hypothetical protein SpiBuddy_2982 [Sphaerochaeta globosa str. Buddy]